MSGNDRTCMITLNGFLHYPDRTAYVGSYARQAMNQIAQLRMHYYIMISVT